jgi:hypothetical protein
MLSAHPGDPAIPRRLEPRPPRKEVIDVQLCIDAPAAWRSIDWM